MRLESTRFFLYVNGEKIESLFDQYYEGLVEIVKTKAKEREVKIGLALKLGKILEWLSPIKPEASAELKNLSLASEQTRKELKGKPELQLAMVLTYLEEKKIVYHMPQRLRRAEAITNRFVLVESEFERAQPESEWKKYRRALPRELKGLLTGNDARVVGDNITKERALNGGQERWVTYSIARAQRGQKVLVLSTLSPRFVGPFGRRELFSMRGSRKLFGRLLNWWTSRILAVDPFAIWSEAR